MGKSITRCLAAAALLAGGLPATAAYGQQREGQRQTQQEVQRGTTVETRRRPDFEPFGVRLGAFRLDGFLEGGVGYDSNVFGRRNNVKDSFYISETGNITLASDWLRHAVGASFNLDSRQFLNQDKIDWTDWNLGGFGRYDIGAFSSVDVRYRHYREHLDTFNFDVQARGIARPIPFDSDEVQIGGTTRLNRLGFAALGLFKTFRFEDVAGQRNREANINSLLGAFTTSYAFSPGRFITATLRLQDITYTESAERTAPTSIIPSDRDSFTWAGLVGFEYDFDGVWAGRFAVGYQQRNYSSPLLKPLEGPALEGRVSWSPTQLTTVTFNVARTIEESIRQDAVSYQRTTGGIRVDHEFLRNVLLGAEIRADRREYTSPDETATDGVVQLNARWLLNRSISVSGSYAHNRRLEATGRAFEFDRNLVQVRVRVAL